MKCRNTIRKIKSHPSSDGDGVNINRIHGFENPLEFSPFLLVDELKSDDPEDYIGGFPPHPHRGIETLTYMLQGHFEHKDHMGNTGSLKTGGAQWMSAGRGVIHSEMPIMDGGMLHGFQIWLNLPATKKMQPSQYEDFQSPQITEYSEGEGNLLRVISGDVSDGEALLSGPLQRTGVPALIADWQAASGKSRTLVFEESFNAMLYVYSGRVVVSEDMISEGHFALLNHGEALNIEALEDSGVLLLAGQVINEPVAHYGPFVMNTDEEIEQALQDYRNGVLTDAP
ncbi:quercetin 2,3-dioxygenase [Veronia nyctiphanis]|uniref:Quercetin 2,3-dioxygenase n=1 Tax=Veronia nyctiphanis TaxID=1278244 RepID=A0A4Q0YTF6_9GAMM|nr:pirin family protein [Veronia nyctiphanis]RXJ74500.1 quercetin 2,3-dioxygenase [Veronia nyctiphanis]